MASREARQETGNARQESTGDLHESRKGLQERREGHQEHQAGHQESWAGHHPGRASSRESAIARWLGVLRLSARQLQQRWLESFLMVVGIALGVGVLTTGETLVRFQQRETVNMAVRGVPEWRAITVQPSRLNVAQMFYGPNAVPAVRVSPDLMQEPVTLTLEDLLTLRREVPGVAYVTTNRWTRGSPVAAVDDLPVPRDAVSSAAPAPSGTSASTSADQAHLETEMVTPDEFGFRGLTFLAGGPFSWEDFAEGRERLVLEARGAARLFPGLDPAEMVGRTVTTTGFPGSEGERWQVIGVVETPSDEAVPIGPRQDPEGPGPIRGFAPTTAAPTPRVSPSTAPSGSSGARTLSFSTLYFTPEQEGLVPEVIGALQAYFDQKHGPGRVDVRNPLAERERSIASVRSVAVALLALAGLGLLIAAVNILNLFTARVLRRQQALGTSLALGATRRLLFWQTSAEALLVGVTGSALGLLLAAAFTELLRAVLRAQAAEFSAGLDPFAGLGLGVADALIGLAAGVGLSLSFGLYPAWLGSRQDPMQALRVE